MLAPTCTLAAPSIAQATPTGIDFAANGSGQAVSSNWNGFYYTNQDSSGNLTVYYTGATAGDSVTLYDDQSGTATALGSPSTADSNGDGSVSFPATSVHNSDQISLSDTSAGTSSATDPHLFLDATPTVTDYGYQTDSSANPEADTEAVDVQGAIPDGQIQLSVDGGAPVTEQADASGGGVFDLSVPSGKHTVTAASVDASGTLATGSATTFTSTPFVDGNYNGGWNFANTSTPTLTLHNVAAGASAIDVYANDNHGDPVTQLQDPADYTYTLGDNETATLTFHTPVNPSYSYGFTQVVNGVESNLDATDAAWLRISLDSVAPNVSTDFYGTLTNERQPTFYVASDGNDYGYLDFQFTLTNSNGNTVASSGPITSHVGSWTPSVSLADGTYTVSATSVDSFGEVGSTTSTPITFTVDDTPPAAPTFTSPAAGATLTSGTPTVTLQTDAGDLVVLCVDDPNNNDCDSVRADANGLATFKVGDYTQNTGGTTALTSGQHKLEAWSYDELYNQSAESSIALDVKPPTTTTTTTTTPTSPTPTATTPAPTTTTPTSTPAATVPSAQEVARALNQALGGISGKSATTAAVVKAGGATLTFKAPSAGTVKVAWYGEVKGKKTLIGSGTKTIGAGGIAKVKVKLDAAGKKLLTGAHGSVKVTQSGSFTPTGGKQHTSSKTLKLKG